jgi:hypothetical protein
MRKILGLLALLVTGALAATSALYLHHERSTQATVEADCQNREICLDKVNLAPLGRFNDGTLWHGVTQEKPNVNLTGTLTVTGATVLSNNLTLSLFATGRIPYTTTAGLLTSGTGLTYNGSAFGVTGTGDISGNFAINTNKFNVTAASGNTTVAGTLTTTGVTTASRININGATDNSLYAVNTLTGNISASNTYGFTSYGIGVPGGTNTENIAMYHNGAAGAIIDVNIAGTGSYRPLLIKTGNATAITVATNQGVQLSSTLGVTGVTTATGGLTLGASFVDKTTSLTSNTTLTSAHSTILADATGGSFTITLPTAVGNTGLTYKILKNDFSSNSVIIGTTSSQTIGTYTAIALFGNQSMGIAEVISNGSNWLVLRYQDQGSFTYTEATGVASTPTATAYWNMNSSFLVTILFNPVAGTGNSTGFTLTGIPTLIRPVSDVFCPVVLTDNGTAISGLAYIGAGSGTITLSTTVASGTPVTYNTAGFTAAGDKRMGNSTGKTSISYNAAF